MVMPVAVLPTVNTKPECGESTTFTESSVAPASKPSCCFVTAQPVPFTYRASSVMRVIFVRLPPPVVHDSRSGRDAKPSAIQGVLSSWLTGLCADVLLGDIPVGSGALGRRLCLRLGAALVGAHVRHQILALLRALESAHRVVVDGHQFASRT